VQKATKYSIVLLSIICCVIK